MVPCVHESGAWTSTHCTKWESKRGFLSSNPQVQGLSLSLAVVDGSRSAGMATLSLDSPSGEGLYLVASCNKLCVEEAASAREGPPAA